MYSYNIKIVNNLAEILNIKSKTCLKIRLPKIKYLPTPLIFLFTSKGKWGKQTFFFPPPPPAYSGSVNVHPRSLTPTPYRYFWKCRAIIYSKGSYCYQEIRLSFSDIKNLISNLKSFSAIKMYIRYNFLYQKFTFFISKI